jgi:selenocysteine lyase/cysteine desulfurase
VEALKFRESIGRGAIERRGRELAQALVEGVRKLNGVTVYTDPAPGRSSAIVVLRPGNLDPRRLGAALAEQEKIVCTVRAGEDRPGLRFAPHLYNTMDEIERTVAAIRTYLARGI